MASTDHILAVHVYWYFCEGLLITAFTTERDKTELLAEWKGAISEDKWVLQGNIFYCYIPRLSLN